MKKLALFAAAGVVLGTAAVTGQEAAPSPEKAIRVLLTFGGHGFQQKPFFAMFAAMEGIEYTKAPLPKSAGMLKPGLEEDYDAIVMYDMARGFKPEQQKQFVELLNAGIGIVSLHHNLGAHRNWDEFRKIIGGKFIFNAGPIDGVEYAKSPWKHGQDVKVHIEATDHPITEGVKDFTIHDETYGKCYVSPDAKVLLTTDNPTSNREIGWVHEYVKSRVVYLMGGHDNHAWSNPNYPLLLKRAIKWAAETP